MSDEEGTAMLCWSAAFFEDLESGEDFAVCAEHLTPVRTEMPGQYDLFGGEVQP